MMQKRHSVLVTVTFDKPCTNAEALAAIRDTIHGDFYPVILTRDDAPDCFKVRRIDRLRLDGTRVQRGE